MATIRKGGQVENALSICEKVLKKSPHHFRAHMNRGLCLSEMKDWTRADQEYDWCIQQQPDNAIPWNNKGANAATRGDFLKANQYTERALELNPTYLDSLEIKAIAYLNLGHVKEAEIALQRCIDLAPSSPKTSYLREILSSLRFECFKIEARKSSPEP